MQVFWQIFSDGEGLYKIEEGSTEALEIASGNFFSPQISSDGRYEVVSKRSEEGVVELFGVNLLTNRVLPLNHDKPKVFRALAYIPALKKFLIISVGLIILMK